jgi:lysophospholipase L1-like esterase
LTPSITIDLKNETGYDLIKKMSSNVVLLGDSIFDNGSYVKEGEADVLWHLRRELQPFGLGATLLAQDGAVTANVFDQMARLNGATHLVISCGGNDSLQVRYGLYELLNLTHTPFGLIKRLVHCHPVRLLLKIRKEFLCNYKHLLQEAQETGLPVIICTIYDKCAGIKGYERLFLSIFFNKIIIRQAPSVGIPIIDLRTLCGEPDDYSEISPIEPSTKGAAKIAKRIALVVTKHSFKFPKTVIY